MTIQEQIHENLTSAIKGKKEDVKSILRVLIGEFNREGKVLSDDVVIPIIKKMVANAIELNNTTEADILNVYLPMQLSDHELETVIENIIRNNSYTTMRDMGSIMKDLKENYNGLYDGSNASKMIKNELS